MGRWKTMTPAQRAKHHIRCQRYRRKHPDRLRAARKEYERKNAKKLQAYRRRYYLCHRAYLRDLQRLRRDGITPEQTKAAMNQQKGCCALCYHPLGKETPCSDHDHVTGKFRGMIHRKCNSGLGQFNDDPKLLKLAVQYLEKHNVRSR